MSNELLQNKADVLFPQKSSVQASSETTVIMLLSFNRCEAYYDVRQKVTADIDHAPKFTQGMRFKTYKVCEKGSKRELSIESSPK